MPVLHQLHTSTSPPCFLSLIIFANSSACFRVRTRIRNSFFPCFPFQTAYAPPTPIATRTLPVLGGTLYFGIFVGWALPTAFPMVGNAHPTKSRPPRRQFRFDRRRCFCDDF